MAMDDAVFHDARQQVAALCWRRTPLPQVLLVTTLSTRRWILPKGWPMEGLSLAQAAAREAEEEAGIIGQVSETPLGSYHYLKERKDGSAVTCQVSVFALEVRGQQDRFAEKGARELVWLAPREAAARVAAPGLARILRNFALPLQPARRQA